MSDPQDIIDEVKMDKVSTGQSETTTGQVFRLNLPINDANERV